MAYGKTWHEGRAVRHHNLVAATQPPITGPIDKGKGGSNTAGKGKGRPKAAAETMNNGSYYNVAAYLDANGQANGTSYATDESRYAHTITYTGSAAVASNVFSFNGTTDYLTVSDGDGLIWTPGSRFTLELRDVAFSSTTGRRVLASSYRADASIFGWYLARTSGGDLVFATSTSGSASEIISYAWTPLTDGTKYNITLAWDGATVRLYIDTAFVASASMTLYPFPGKQPLRIGADLASGGAARDFFAGTIRAVRFTKGLARVTGTGTIVLPTLPWPTTQGALTDSQWGNVLLLLSANDDGTIWDDSPYDWPLEQGGTPTVSTSVEPFADANSVVFDGSTDYLQIRDNPYFEIGSGAVTLEGFVRHSNVGTAQTYLGKWNTSGNQRSYGWDFQGGSSTLRWILSTAGSSANVAQSDAWSPTVDTWYHNAYCRSGTSNRKFVGGSQVGTTQTDGSAAFNSSSFIYIGAINSTGITSFMNGYMSELRVTKAARYTAGFTAPSTVFPRG